MFAEFKIDQGVNIAVLSETLDNPQGEEFVSQMERTVPKGGKLIVDGTYLKTLTQQGVLHLMAAQRWTAIPERKRLLLVGFNLTVWRAIVENGSDFIFDSKPNLDEALQSLGASASSIPAVVPPPSAPARTAPASAPRGKTEAEPWRRTFPNDPPAISTPPPAASAPVSSFVFSTPAPQPLAKKSGKGFVWAAIAALVLVAAGWWWLGSRPPELTLSAPSTVVEEDGKEPDEVTVQVRHGRLLEKSTGGLPKGLYFEPPSDESGTRTYTLRGKAEPGARTATVQLIGVNDKDQRSVPAAFTVTVTEKPMSWQINVLQYLNLKVGKQIWAQCKFLVNADRVIAKTALPSGLTVERIPGKNKDWQLTGTPTAAGSFPVVFMATSPAGREEEQSCTLRVTADAAPSDPPPASEKTPDKVVSTRKSDVARSDLDDGMRRFLLERIENLPSRYSDNEREQLRAVVGTLRQARLVCRVVFERDGQTDISGEQIANLKAALADFDNAALLKNPACQTVIVGFASKTGNPASNVRLSKQRANNVNGLVKGVIGHNADLCGDYGPTNVVDQNDDQSNRAVEVYAGLMEPTPDMLANAESFKREFNHSHGMR